MQWKKLGLLWAPNGESEWACTHATLPVVQRLSNDEWWVYVSTRDAQGKSRIGRLTVVVNETGDYEPRVRHFDPSPVLSLGVPGTFDDSGVMPASLVQDGDHVRLYYVGWNVLATVPYRQSIGVAVSDDGGATFRRYSPGPLIDRSIREPYFVTSPFVLRENDLWRMWYVSCTGWEQIEGRWEPAYHVKYAQSRDGFDWNVTGVSCLDAGAGFAVARPCVFPQGRRFGMLYPYRSLRNYRTDPDEAYQLGYAESDDGIKWERRDHEVGIERSTSGWDSEMLAYGWLQRHGNQTYLLYNGNGFGRSGVGVAKFIEA